MATPDDGRGMVTPAQQELLTGERTYSGSSKRAMWSECRENIRSALRDFPLLFDALKGDDFEELIYPSKSPAIDRNTILAGIAFLYKAAAAHPHLDPEAVVEDSVSHAEFDMGREATVDIETEELAAIEFSEILQREGIVDSVPEALAILQSRTFDRKVDDPHGKTYGRLAGGHYQAAVDNDEED
jgi:hypothetical protein